MEIQSLSIVVPVKGRCVNRCPFCVSDMSESPYRNQIEDNERFYGLYRQDYLERLAFARDNGCHSAVITGDGEPLQNKAFLKHLSDWNDRLPSIGSSRFRNIDLQTSGVLLTDQELRFLRNDVRVSTIALSVVDIFSSDNNASVMGQPLKAVVDIDGLAEEIKKYDFNLRVSINLTNLYDQHSIPDIFARLNALGADQVIFRVLYESGQDSQKDEWVRANRCSEKTVGEIGDYIRSNGRPLEQLSFGATRYSVHGLSTVLDEQCMPNEVTRTYRYLVLRENCKLYSRWDDPASLVF